MKCPSCGGVSSPEDKFCSRCGTPLTEFPWGKYCTYCNLREKKDAQGRSYCVECEGPFDKEKLEEEETVTSVPPSTPLKSWTPILIAGIIISFLLVGFLFYKWRVYAEVKSAHTQQYLKFLKSSVDKYKKITEEMGEIGSLVFTPEEEGFEDKKSEAENRLEELKREVEKELEIIETKKCPKSLEEEKEHLKMAYQGLISQDFKELELFLRASDPEIIAMMMRGDISQTPFQKAVAPCDSVKKAMDEVIKGMYEKGY
jgi:uncharacterized membrane protein YvbJ